MNVKGVVAEYERETIRDRCVRGKREKARLGFVRCGLAPYGYQLQPPGRLVVDEQAAVIVRRIFSGLVERRLSIRAIGLELMADAVPSPRGRRRWAPSQIRRVLENETYTGKRWYNPRRGRRAPA